ncbi:MAG: Holliday junction branch migration protein RuvA [Rikenellaceae bacterium]|nr:Holliday junction branch migration protein RuvA [Rikenellaceae bacterium]
MYEYISGTLAEIAPAYAVVEAGGVGYFINISLNTFSQIERAERVKLFTHHIVREDIEMLYGFASKEERDLFRLLISVSGVGGNTARMIQSTYSPSELRNIIATGNAVLLKNVKGLGLKTAQKIIVDLSGKMIDLPSHDAASNALAASQHPEAYDEALAALVMLGFAKAASEKVLQKVFKADASLGVEEAIRSALKQL